MPKKQKWIYKTQLDLFKLYLNRLFRLNKKDYKIWKKISKKNKWKILN